MAEPKPLRLRSAMGAFLGLLFYLVVFFTQRERLASWGPYASYFFDLGFVLLVFLLTRAEWDLRWKIRLHQRRLGEIFLAFLCGGLVAFLALFTKILIPFDLHQPLTLVLLLFVGPLLEEFLFRGAFWKLFHLIFQSDWSVLVLTSALFSFAHFHAFWFVPDTVVPFVLYQSAYTAFLGLACGWLRLQNRSLWPAVLFHIFFNFGFFAAAH